MIIVALCILDSFIGPKEFVVGYSKAPKQPQSSARPICHSHTMMNTGREPATIRIAAYRSSPSLRITPRETTRYDNQYTLVFTLCIIG